MKNLETVIRTIEEIIENIEDIFLEKILQELKILYENNKRNQFNNFPIRIDENVRTIEELSSKI